MSYSTKFLVCVLGVGIFYLSIHFWLHDKQQQAGSESLKNEGSSFHRSDTFQNSNNQNSAHSHFKYDHQASEKITPDVAKRQLMEAYQIVDIDLRGDTCYNIMKALCLAGYTQEALALIHTEFGEARTSQITAVFKYGRWTIYEASEQIKKLAENGYRGDGTRALNSFCDSLNLIDFENAINSSLFANCIEFVKQRAIGQPDLTDSAIAFYLADRIYSLPNSGDREIYLKSAFGFHDEGHLSDYGLARVIGADASLSVFEKWKYLANRVESVSSNDSFNDLRNDLVRSMVDRNSAAAISEISRVESPQASEAFGIAVQRWLLNDGSSVVSEWYLNNRGSLSPTKRDSVAEMFFNDALANGERDSAEQWIREFQNPQLRATNLARLADLDRKQSE